MENDKIISQLATLTEQGRWVSNELHEIKQDVKHIKDSHMSFKFKIVGFSACIGFFAAMLVELLRR
jgi:type III secretory pathway component EscS